MWELPKSRAPERRLEMGCHRLLCRDYGCGTFCIISAKFASCWQDEVRGSSHSMMGGNFLDLDRKDSLL